MQGRAPALGPSPTLFPLQARSGASVGRAHPTGWNNVFYMLIAADGPGLLSKSLGHTDG